MRALFIGDGDVTRVGELRFAANGSPWIPFTIRSTERRGNNFASGSSNHDIICWGEIANFAHNNVRHGCFVRVVGTVRYRKDDNTGAWKMQVSADEIDVLLDENGKRVVCAGAPTAVSPKGSGELPGSTARPTCTDDDSDDRPPF